MQRQQVALDRALAGSVLRLPALQCHTRTRYDGSIALNTCSATVPKWLRWRRKRATFKHFECLGLLLRGVSKSRGADGVCGCFFLMSRTVASHLLGCCFVASYQRPGLLLVCCQIGRYRSTQNSPPRGRQKSGRSAAARRRRLV